MASHHHLATTPKMRVRLETWQVPCSVKALTLLPEGACLALAATPNRSKSQDPRWCPSSALRFITFDYLMRDHWRSFLLFSLSNFKANIYNAGQSIRKKKSHDLVCQYCSFWLPFLQVANWLVITDLWWQSRYLQCNKDATDQPPYTKMLGPLSFSLDVIHSISKYNHSTPL